MKHVSILVPRGHISVVNIEGTYQILSEVNGLLKEMGREPVFEVHLVGLVKTEEKHGLFSVKPDVGIENVPKTDLIIIPAIHGDQEKVLSHNQSFMPWVIQQYENGAEVASFCIGSFFLAASGLLKGKQCTTHWKFIHEFRQMYPEAQVVDDKIMTEQEGIYTSGGAYSYLNLLLYLIEKYAGREVAVFISKAFMIDIDRTSQSPFIIFQGQKTHEDEEVRQAQEFIEQNFQEKISLDTLASMFAMGRRNLERRFKKATSNTVTEYIQRVKVEAAKMSLESSRENVNEVMYKVGYTDNKAFRAVFKKITGLSPAQYRNKYNREAAVSAS
ncbi:transcriptional regulator GlxA family with amidase domain [Catalinimonas alkaloidigena]|uniref:GlxA family transcriptional regulator n=1 Tax=Catalinimonas alkaloidigena TaxID=1075417 RepID=UPI0024069633|nr:helix-turn-helix domain-containing protein [Catalinimonas alkaloidigena]MDF9798707.1 transcriptional regulator GlxA family with amidase domain [Catalinimonas alkaloidigena]